MSTIYPFFFQYGVQPNEKHPEGDDCLGAIATVIVFAENSETGQARATRKVGRNHWNITEVKRAMMITMQHVANLDGEMKQLYTRAEQNGIAALFDGWRRQGARLCMQE